MSDTKAKAALHSFLRYGGFGRVEQEVQIVPERKWRADFMLHDQHPPVIIEYDGVMRSSRGRGDDDHPVTGHSSIAGIIRDIDKGNAAQAAGFRFYRTTARQIEDGSIFTFLDKVLQRREVR